MEKNSDLAKGFFRGDKTNLDELWKNLCVELNSEGPPQKDVNGWKKVLNNFVLNILCRIIIN